MRFYQQLKNVYHYIEAQFWRAAYAWPDTKLHLYGVTGTDGKTTTCYVLASILAAAHGPKRVGMLSTEVFRVGQREIHNATKYTTLPSRLAFRWLRDMVNVGVTHAVLEMTSHALDQHRFAGIALDGAIILNITHEHLDYHGTMEEYARAKGNIAHYLKPQMPLIGKGDDPWVRRVLHDGQLSGVSCQLFDAGQARSVVTPLPGDFNKENVLAASLLARALVINEAAIDRGVAAVRQVPGRVEWLDLPRGAKAVIDFALTPRALERLYQHLRPLTSGRLIAVFGATGNRDRRKRPLMCATVAKYADEIVVTRDEPYTEPEEQIFQELEAGLAGVRIPWRRIPDRRDAIRYALTKAQFGDVIAITGMGNFMTMAVGTKQLPWNDKQVVQELMRELP